MIFSKTFTSKTMTKYDPYGIPSTVTTATCLCACLPNVESGGWQFTKHLQARRSKEVQSRGFSVLILDIQSQRWNGISSTPRKRLVCSYILSSTSSGTLTSLLLLLREIYTPLWLVIGMCGIANHSFIHTAGRIRYMYTLLHPLDIKIRLHLLFHRCPRGW